MVDEGVLGDLDAAGVCAAVEERHAALVAAEAELFWLAAHWADLHCGVALNDGYRLSGRRLLPGMERGRQVGADGTPLVGEFAAAELGALRGMGAVAARHLIRDALNVRHRHPRLWQAVMAGRVRVWQARQTAQLCAEAGLDLAQAMAVDAQTSDYAGALPWGRFETLVQAKIVEADPAAAEERRVAAALRRFVRTGQSSRYGLKTLVARATAGDVVFFVAMVDRIAHLLAADGDTDSVEVRRSKAIGILATPARALHMLHTAAQTDEQADDQAAQHAADQAGQAGPTERTTDSGEEADDPEVVGELDLHPSQNDADDPAPGTHACPTCAGAGQVTGDPAGFVRPRPLAPRTRLDPRRLLPPATLYIHISSDLLHPDATGVARCEGVGPITRQQVIEFLAHTNVRVVPVLDLAGQEPVDGYEVPDQMAEALHLRNPACASPWSTNLSRKKDHDHIQPYLPRHRGGPPGQTQPGNLAALSRFAHRLKTHGGWRLHQPTPGVYEWRTRTATGTASTTPAPIPSATTTAPNHNRHHEPRATASHHNPRPRSGCAASPSTSTSTYGADGTPPEQWLRADPSRGPFGAGRAGS